MAKKPSKKKQIESIQHGEASRKNIPTAEFQSIMQKGDLSPIQLAYQRRNRDLDPQLVWRGKDEQDWSDLVVQAAPLYIQEKVHPKVLIDDLKKETEKASKADSSMSLDLFADFNGLPNAEAKTEFYQHDQNWSNRMILGDSLQVMASLAERESLKGQVQCIFIDPPYGIKFNSNFQWSTTSRDVTDGKVSHITREPEQVKAFRDTWRDGVHTYLTYLRDRMTVARDLLTESGSLFVQIGDENVHRVRALLDEVFGEKNIVSQIAFVKTAALQGNYLSSNYDYILWYARDKSQMKYRQLYVPKKERTELGTFSWMENDITGICRRLSRAEMTGEMPMADDSRRFRASDLSGQGATSSGSYYFDFRDSSYTPSKARHWTTNREGMQNLAFADRIVQQGRGIAYKRFEQDYPVMPIVNVWDDTIIGTFTQKTYVVQTGELAIARCILMSTDPGDLVLDPTCGSGTSAYVAEEWGRRWIIIDTSRVALALTRARIMGARYPFHILADSREGQIKEAELSDSVPSEQTTYENIRQGFVYNRVPHITLKSIANNKEIEVIWDRYKEKLEPIRKSFNDLNGSGFKEWEIPFEADLAWSTELREVHQSWWELRISRQQAIENSIAAKTDYELLYDRPYSDRTKVRVAGPFTVESLLPHRTLTVGANNELIDPQDQHGTSDGEEFIDLILENLRRAGVQQAHKETKISFTSLGPWPGNYVCAEGKYFEGTEEKGTQRRAAILIGPEFGTVSRPDLVAAAREAGDGDFDVLITCAFNYDAHAADFNNLGRIPVLKARMNADLHMADDLKNTGKGNLFVIFGEPDIDILESDDTQIQVKVNGVDVFHPNTGEIRSNNTDEIACWFIDTDYNEESFFVRHAYFLGANDPYKALKTTLKAEINEEAWESLHSAVSRPFEKPESGRIAVKVINHLGDEVMKVYSV